MSNSINFDYSLFSNKELADILTDKKLFPTLHHSKKWIHSYLDHLRENEALFDTFTHYLKYHSRNGKLTIAYLLKDLEGFADKDSYSGRQKGSMTKNTVTFFPDGFTFRFGLSKGEPKDRSTIFSRITNKLNISRRKYHKGNGIILYIGFEEKESPLKIFIPINGKTIKEKKKEVAFDFADIAIAYRLNFYNIVEDFGCDRKTIPKYYTVVDSLKDLIPADKRVF